MHTCNHVSDVCLLPSLHLLVQSLSTMAAPPVLRPQFSHMLQELSCEAQVVGAAAGGRGRDRAQRQGECSAGSKQAGRQQQRCCYEERVVQKGAQANECEGAGWSAGRGSKGRAGGQAGRQAERSPWGTQQRHARWERSKGAFQCWLAGKKGVRSPRTRRLPPPPLIVR